jgi:hypothetical protein
MTKWSGQVRSEGIRRTTSAAGKRARYPIRGLLNSVAIRRSAPARRIYRTHLTPPDRAPGASSRLDGGRPSWMWKRRWTTWWMELLSRHWGPAYNPAVIARCTGIAPAMQGRTWALRAARPLGHSPTDGCYSCRPIIPGGTGERVTWQFSLRLRWLRPPRTTTKHSSSCVSATDDEGWAGPPCTTRCVPSPHAVHTMALGSRISQSAASRFACRTCRAGPHFFSRSSPRNAAARNLR